MHKGSIETVCLPIGADCDSTVIKQTVMGLSLFAGPTLALHT